MFATAIGRKILNPLSIERRVVSKRPMEIFGYENMCAVGVH